MTDPRHDIPGTPADQAPEADNDRTESDSTLHAEPLANGEPVAIRTERTVLDDAPDADPTASDADFDPATASSDTELSDTELSDTESSDTESPDTELSDTESSDTELSETELSETELSDTELSDTELSDTAEPGSGRRPNLRLGKPVVSRADFAAGPSAVEEPGGNGKPGADSDARWREIQAIFVDDPRGSVEQALQAVDDEVTAVIDALRRRQDELAPVGQGGGQDYAGQSADQPDALAASSNPGDTERLRIALRDCRAFWADLAELGVRLG